MRTPKVRKLGYGTPNDMEFGPATGAYRCHSCGSEHNHVELMRPISSELGCELEMTLSCEHCTTLSIFKIVTHKGYIYMGVVAHEINLLQVEADAQEEFEKNLARPASDEWP